MKNFIEHSVFDEIMSEIDTEKGGKYQDIATIYGDMSRLVVAIMLKTPTKELQAKYNELGWGGSANVIAIHKAAKHWYLTHHPDLI